VVHGHLSGGTEPNGGGSMPEIVCEHCQHTQLVTLFDSDPECDNCGSKALTQTDATSTV